MSARIFLNELKTGERQLAQPEAAKWKADPNFLQRFSNDIYVKGTVADGVVNSVPSVFARPIQFYQALSRQEHPSHQPIRDQWRGLLAIFALRSPMELPVQLQPFRLPEPAAARLDRQFNAILRAQFPHPAEEWTQWLLVYCDQQLVGATSPWSIVYTPAEYRIRSGVQWIDKDGHLADPFKSLYSEEGDNDELRALVTWIELLLDKHPWGMPDHHEDKSGVIRRELEEWRAELLNYVKPLQGVRELDPLARTSSKPYSEFLTSLQVPSLRTSVSSDLTLKDEDGCNTLVLSRSALRNARFAKRRIDGPVRVEHLDLSERALPGPAQKAGWKTPNGITVQKPYVIAEEYFLSERLASIPLSNGALSAGNREYALPLRPEFFRHFSLAKIDANMLSIEPAGDGVNVRLKLPLAGGDELEVEKHYTKNDIEQLPVGRDVPALAIWPDLCDDSWNEYEALLVEGTGDQPQSLYFAPIFEDGNTGSSARLTDKDPNVAVWKSEKPILGFHVEAPTGRAKVTAGVIVRAEALRPNRSNKTWNIGIDFGTSNTEIKIRSNDGEQPLKLHGRTLLLTNAAATAERLKEIHHEGEVVPPFPTLLRKETIAMVSATGIAPQHVGIVALRPDPPAVARNSALYVRDIKWTADQDTQKMFLDRLMTMIALEARAAGVGKLNLRWSYPLSLPGGIRTTMESFWSSVGSGHSGKGFSVETADGFTESDALSRYVSAREVLPIAADSLSIAVDIGGGSTDVAYWSEQTLIDRLSLNIAGNDVIRLAASFPSVNAYLFSDSHQGLSFVQDAINSQPEIMWNVQLALRAETNAPHAHPFLTQMNKANLEQWRFCRTGTFLALGGVFFYIGIQAGRNITQGIGGVSIYVGGRGSALLAWLAPPARLAEILISNFRTGLSISSPNAKPEVEIRGPVVGTAAKVVLKEEVAAGLLERKELSAPARAGFDHRVTAAGEINWVDANGQALDWDAPISTDTLPLLKPPSNHNSSFAAYYLNQVVRPAASERDLDTAGISSLQLSQNWAVNEMRRKREEYMLQPIFAYELKSLMKRYVESVTSARE